MRSCSPGSDTLGWVDRELDFAPVFGAIASMEARMLKPEHINRMISARDLKEALAVLRDTDYSTLAERLLPILETREITSKDIGSGIEEHFNSVLSRINAVIPDKKYLRIFTLKYDVHNLKILIKYRFSREGYIGSKFASFRELSPDVVREVAYNYDVLILKSEDIVRLSKYTLKELYYHINDPLLSEMIKEGLAFLARIEKIEAVESSEAILDDVLDGWMYSKIMKMIQSMEEDFPDDHEFLTRLQRTYIDLLNIGMILRSTLRGAEVVSEEDILDGGFVRKEKLTAILATGRIDGRIEALKALPDYGKLVARWDEAGRSFAEWDGIKEETIDKLLSSREMTFSPGRVIAFLRKAEKEAKIISGILNARISGLSGEMIRRVVPGGE